jgi:purine-binding chemotaxis protein CheW
VSAVETTENASWEDLARDANASAEAAAEETLQLLALELAGDVYAVPVESVREIVRIRPITPVPRVCADVRGVIALRGEIVQVIDLRSRLGLEPVEPSRSSRIVVVHLEDGRIAGVLVDAVCEVMRVPESAIVPPSGGETASVEAMCRRGDQFVSLIALSRVLQFDVEI